MNSPVMSALKLARADDRLQQLKYEAPKSWDRDAKLAFLHLPPPVQAYYVDREKARDRAVRNAQNEAGALRREVAELKAKLKEVESVHPASADPIETKSQERPMAILSKPTKAPPLEARIKELRDEIDAFIEAKVQAIKAGEDGGSPIEGIPDTVLRNILMNRSDGCLCKAYLNIGEQGR